MLRSQKNKQTVDILRRLREQGAPEPAVGTVPLDMVSELPKEGSALEPTALDEFGRPLPKETKKGQTRRPPPRNK